MAPNYQPILIQRLLIMNTKAVPAQPVFDSSSPHFWAMLFQAGLAVFAMFNIQFPQPIGELSETLATTLTTGGIYSIVGILFVSVLGPIYTAITKKSIKLIWASTSTWIYLGTAVASLFTLFGIAIPSDSVSDLVAAVWAKDWFTVGGMATTLFLVPIIRFIKLKLKKPTGT